MPRAEAAERGAETVCRNLVAYLADGSLDGCLNRAAVEAGDCRPPEVEHEHRARSAGAGDRRRQSGSCRALLFDASGALLGLAQREWSYHPVEGWPGGFDFDTDAGWESVQVCIREALAKAGVDAGEVAAVSASSMREGFVLYDEAGEAIWACPNIDARAGQKRRR